jgi:uncharacterized protein YycO
MMRSMLIAATLVLSATATGCSHSMVVSRPADKQVDEAYTVQFADDLEANAQDGDIVLRRGYAVLSDMITLVTSGPDMSHAAIYDAQTKTVIEAVDGGVKETNLRDFVSGAHRVMIVRPADLRWTDRRAAVEKARTAIGTPFDYSGFVGLDNPNRFYCSELVAWAIDLRGRGYRVSRLIAPGALAKYGDTVYDSGERGKAPLSGPRVASR